MSPRHPLAALLAAALLAASFPAPLIALDRSAPLVISTEEPPPSPPPPPPPINASDDLGAIDYALDATADIAYADRRVTLTETITLTNGGVVPFNAITLLHFPRAVGAWRDQSISVGGVSVTPTYPTDLAMTLPIDPPLDPAATTTIELRGVINLLNSTDTMGRLGTKGRFIGLGSWLALPGRSVARNMVGDPVSAPTASLMRLTVRTDVAMKSAAVQGSGTATLLPDVSGTEWRFELADARAAAVGINPDFVQARATESVSGVIIIATSPSSSRASALLNDAKSALASYATWFGPAPYSRLRVVETGILGNSQEFPGVVFIGANGTTTASQRTYLVRHEAAHQWWFGLSANDQLRAPWADEAFAEFAARLKAGTNPSSCSTRKIDLAPDAYGRFSGACGAYFESVYLRGTRMLFAVRAKIGQAKLLGCLRDYIQANRFAETTGPGLADVLEACDPQVRAVISPYLSSTTLDPAP